MHRPQFILAPRLRQNIPNYEDLRIYLVRDKYLVYDLKTKQNKLIPICGRWSCRNV